MRAKEFRLLITFYTTADAMAMEQHCKRNGIPGRLLPVPRAISSDCGIAWCCDTSLRQEIEKWVETGAIEPAGFYEMYV